MILKNKNTDKSVLVTTAPDTLLSIYVYSLPIPVTKNGEKSGMRMRKKY